MPFAAANGTWTRRLAIFAAPVTTHVVERRGFRGRFDVGAKFAACYRQITRWVGELLVRGDFERRGTKPEIIVMAVRASPEVNSFAGFLINRY